MFERFTDGARRVVVLAQEEAHSLRHGYIGTEHLLLGLLREEDGMAASVLGRAGVTADDARDGVRATVGEGFFGAGDADALHAIGIDLDAVRAKVEEAFGPGALERAVQPLLSPGGDRRRRRRRRRARRACADGTHIPMTPRAKKVLELSLREALKLRHPFIGTEHVLLGLLAEGEGVGARLLAERGLSLDDLRQRVLVALGRVA